MTAPQQPNDPQSTGGSVRPQGADLPPEELGSTAQFKAFVNGNDDPDEARERAAADPDGHRPAPANLPDDREIEFSPAPPRREQPEQSQVRPSNADLPPEELGSTAQFKAFASGDDTDANAAAADRGSLTNDRARPQTEAVLPEDHDPTSSEIMGAPNDPRTAIQPADLPPVNPDNKRNLYIALAIVALVIIVVVLLLIIG